MASDKNSIDSIEEKLKNLTAQYDEAEDRLIIGLDFGTTYSGQVSP
jgi:hypothetical protein